MASHPLRLDDVFGSQGGKTIDVRIVEIDADAALAAAAITLVDTSAGVDVGIGSCIVANAMPTDTCDGASTDVTCVENSNLGSRGACTGSDGACVSGDTATNTAPRQLHKQPAGRSFVWCSSCSLPWSQCVNSRMLSGSRMLV
jgi:hypothetical protein